MGSQARVWSSHPCTVVANPEVNQPPHVVPSPIARPLERHASRRAGRSPGRCWSTDVCNPISIRAPVCIRTHRSPRGWSRSRPVGAWADALPHGERVAMRRRWLTPSRRLRRCNRSAPKRAKTLGAHVRGRSVFPSHASRGVFVRHARAVLDADAKLHLAPVERLLESTGEGADTAPRYAVVKPACGDMGLGAFDHQGPARLGATPLRDAVAKVCCKSCSINRRETSPAAVERCCRFAPRGLDRSVGIPSRG